MGSFILVGGEITKRLAFPHAVTLGANEFLFEMRKKRRLCLAKLVFAVKPPDLSSSCVFCDGEKSCLTKQLWS
ncbi:ATP-dependent Clp protease proteolytic subunit [Platanthera zijinensis]|uniref:ATP-dependent Clp protease proteolytic subunit n=1 Tax=Platanthera zijinensis TaxID=2320716 RepID=A0AAP0BGK0_9ASPA